ncbi:MAG TPA: archaeosortase A [Candidatus Thermoplasmatota archaeon]|nr:archaeosortase A [Candidatus Thermoplasmatota archaeon]
MAQDLLESGLLLMVFVGLGLLAAGFFVKDPRKHLLRIAGWALFAIYWPFQAPHFFNDADPVNGYFALAAPLFLGYIAWHEWKSYQWKEDPHAMRWLTGTSVVAAASYFVIYRIPEATEALIRFTAGQTSWMLAFLFGVESSIQPSIFEAGSWDVFLTGGGTEEYAVTIILACTAIQSIMIFVGAIASLERSPRRNRLLAYAITVPVIYFLNLFRNSGIVFAYKVWDFPAWFKGGWDAIGQPISCLMGTCFPIGELGTQARFEFMHSVLGKGGSLVALIVIALGVFMLLPELHNNILDLFDLRKRNRKGFYDPPPPPGPADPPASAPPAPPAAAKPEEA